MNKRLSFFLAASLLLLFSCGKKDKVPSGWTDTIGVEALVINDGSTPTERNYVGDIESEQEATLSFALGGSLTMVAVKNGDRVTKGQMLAKVDATTAAILHLPSGLPCFFQSRIPTFDRCCFVFNTQNVVCQEKGTVC